MGITGARGGVAIQAVGTKGHGLDRTQGTPFVNGFTSGAHTKGKFSVVGAILLSPKQKKQV